MKEAGMMLNHLLYPDAALFDEAVSEVMLDQKYRPQDVGNFNEEQTLRFHSDAAQVVREKLSREFYER